MGLRLSRCCRHLRFIRPRTIYFELEGLNLLFLTGLSVQVAFPVISLELSIIADLL